MTKEIIVLSGKGGAGKTTYAAALSYLAQDDAIVADCDVDASDMHLLLQPHILSTEDFYSGETAQIDPNRCLQCGDCADVCRFDAISNKTASYQVDNLKCEGCGYCPRICPAQAIKMENTKNGELYISTTRHNMHMVHAEMEVGGENSGKLVTKVKEEAKVLALKKQKTYIILDGSPGIGCPVTAGLNGVKLAVLVTEPTVSGIHDIKRLIELIEKMKIKTVAVINKASINTQKAEEIKTFFAQKNIPVIQEIPYNKKFVEAVSVGKTIPEYLDGQTRRDFEQAWTQIKEYIK